jgi:predicted nucleic acid-binding protein
MRFWDASAIVPLVVSDAATPAVSALFREDPGQVVWCLTEVEVHSALARRDRDGSLEREPGATALKSLGELARSWEEVVVLDIVRSRAIRLLRAHSLRAADALQLAAALVVSEERPESLPFVSLDDRLSDAARKEGFPVLP